VSAVELIERHAWQPLGLAVTLTSHVSGASRSTSQIYGGANRCDERR
jgi:hypothetical protein